MVWRMDRTSTSPTPDSSVCTLSAHLPGTAARLVAALRASPGAALTAVTHTPTSTYAVLYICRVQLKFRIRFLVVITEYDRLSCPLHESTSSIRARLACRLMFRRGLQMQFAPRPRILLLRLQLQSMLRRPTPHRLEPKNRAKAAQRPPRRKFN